jgi:hypothetical protein
MFLINSENSGYALRYSKNSDNALWYSKFKGFWVGCQGKISGIFYFLY